MEQRSNSRYAVFAVLLCAAMLLGFFSTRSSTEEELYRRLSTPVPNTVSSADSQTPISVSSRSTLGVADPVFHGLPYQRLRVGMPCKKITSRGDDDPFILSPDTSLALLTPVRQQEGSFAAQYAIQERVVIDYVITHVSPFSVVARAATPSPANGTATPATSRGRKAKMPQAQRIRDWNELYWCLKSIYLHGQLCLKDNGKECLLRKIHLVVADKSHVPDWLACRLGVVDESPSATDAGFRQFLRAKLNVVEHKHIFRQKRNFTVSYNSNVIELNLHNVPGLSPFYVYFNNDFYLGRTLRLLDLFAPVPPAVVSGETSDVTSCDLVPITYYASRIKRSSPQEAAEDGEEKLKSDEKKKKAPSLHTTFTRFNRGLLLQLAPLVSGEARQEVTLKYAHVPTVFDKVSLEWLLRLDVLSPLREDTERRPIRRGSKDLWVPYLYINVHYLAYNCSDCFRHPIANAIHQKDLYRFVQLRDETTILKQIRRAVHWVQRPLFMTLNDDIPNAISAVAVDPSTLLFNGTKCALSSAEDFLHRCSRCGEMAGCQLPALKDTLDVVEGTDYQKFEQLLKEVPGKSDVVKIARGKVAPNITAGTLVPGRLEGSQYLATRYMQLIHILYCRQIGERFAPTPS